VLAWFAAYDELGVGDQSVAEGDFFDDVGVVARPAEPLVDYVDETDVFAAVEPGVHQIGPIDVEDHESSRTGAGAEGGLGEHVSLCHGQIMTRGCYTVAGDRSAWAISHRER
jgi:hypothetical protein